MTRPSKRADSASGYREENRGAAPVLLAVLLLGAAGVARAQESASCTATSAAVTETNPKDDAAAEALAMDCAFLLDIKGTLEGSSPSTPLNWAPNLDMADWNGISLTSRGNRVGGILLPSWGLNGTMPTSFAALSGLTSLRITSSGLGGGVPALPAGLQHLDVSENALTGTIPDLSDLTSLRQANLSANELTGGIPALPASLAALRLIDNDLSGEIGDLSAATSLLHLHLDYNGFTGDIPDATELPEGLQQLQVSRNGLNGTSFPDLSALTSLVHIWLSGNELGGTLPAASSLPPGLQRFLIYDNRLTGPIPDLSALTSLTDLYLWGNELSGPIPAATALPPNVRRLALGSNDLDQAIPDLSALTALDWFYVSGNALTGNVPTAAELPAGLQRLILGGNELTGGIPDLGTRTSLTHLDLHLNALTGSIPTTLPPSLQTLHLAGNDLANSIPPQLGGLTALTQLSLCGNSLTGTLPPALEIRRGAGTLAVHSCAAIADASGTEGAALAFAVTHDTFPAPGAAGATKLTLSYETADGTATSADYAGTAEGAPGTVTIRGNTNTETTTSTATISIATTEDAAIESDEEFTVTVALPKGTESVFLTRAEATGTIEDDARADVTVDLGLPSAGAVTEGGTLTISATVSQAPSGTSLSIPLQRVTGAVSTATAADYSLAAAITIADGMTTGTATLTAADDTADEPVETLRLELGTLPAAHARGPTPHVDIAISDNDPTTVTLTTPDAAAREGDASDTATIRLTLGRGLVFGESLAIPLQFHGGDAGTDFTLAQAGSRTGVAFDATNSTATFTGPSARTADLVLTPASDPDAEDLAVTVSMPATSTGAAPKLTARNLDGGATGSLSGHGLITITDDETKRLLLSVTRLMTVVEESNASYTVKLASRPTSDVTVTADGHERTALMLDKATLIFSASTWHAAQIVTVTATPDPDTANETVTLTHAASGGGYNGVSETVTIVVTDNDETAPPPAPAPEPPPPAPEPPPPTPEPPPPAPEPPPPAPEPPTPKPEPPPPTPEPPEASFGIAGAACADDLCTAFTGAPVTFEDTSTGAVTERAWHTGDNGVFDDSTLAHAWTEPGFYRLTLTVGGPGGSDDTHVDFLVRPGDPAGTCDPDDFTLCLQDERYRVEVDWWTAGGENGRGAVVREGTNDSGIFRFFDDANWEVLVKVLDACDVDRRHWVFAAATTDVGYEIAVTDTAGADRPWVHRNAPGTPAAATTDTSAFPNACEH